MVDAGLLRGRVELVGAQQSAQQLRLVGKEFDDAGRKAAAVAGPTGKAGQGFGQAGTAAGLAGVKVKDLKAGLSQLSPVALGTTGAIVGIGLATKATLDASIAWESSLAGVSKTLDTTGLSAEQAQQAVADIGAELRQMALDIPITATELAGVAEAAGQLGIARDDVVTFTETMAKLGVATDLTAEQAATAIARIANITGLATEDVDNFGAALVDLGNHSAATESEILMMATRIAAAGNMAGLTEGEILGLAAALTSVGINAEAGGTAVTQVMAEITKSVEMADGRLATFAEIAGMSAQQFATAWRAAPADAIAAFVEGLAEMEASGDSSILALDELGLAGVRQSQALRSAAGAGDLMRDSMERGNTAMSESVALNTEAAQRFETTASKIQLAKNEMNESAIVIGENLAPALVVIIDAAAEATGVLASLAEMLTETGQAAVAVSGGGPSGGGGLDDYMIGLGAAFRIASGGSQDLSGDLDKLWTGLLLGRDVTEEVEAAVRAAAQEHENAARRVQLHTTQLDLLRQAGQGYVQEQREGAEADERRAERVRAYQENVTDLNRELEDGTEWNLKWHASNENVVDVMIEAWEASRRGTEEGHRYNQMASDSVGVYEEQIVAAGKLAAAQAGLAETYQTAGFNAEIFNRQGAEYKSIASDLTDAYDILNQRKEDGIALTDEETRFLADYEENLGRTVGGQEDATVQAGLYRQAQVGLMKAQDELTDAINRGGEDLGPYQDAVADAEGKLNDAATASGGMRSANELLTDIILTQLVPALQDINQTLTDINNNPATAKVDADTSAAEAALQAFRDALANNPATIDLYVNQIGAIGFTSNAAGGPVKAGQMALVGEEGPELIVPQGDVEVISNPETMRLLKLMGNFVGGFAEGTGGDRGGGPSQGVVGFDASGFVGIGEQIAAAIKLGIELGLIESGTPTGEAYAQALIEGATKTIETEGADGVTEAWVVAHERIPELAANLGSETVVALLQEYANLQGELQLAILSGNDTGEIQAQMDAIFAIFAAWSGNSVEEVEAVWDAISDEARAEAAKALWDDVLASIQTPGAPVSITVDDIISGDALAEVQATFQELWDLQKMYQEAGMPEQAAAIGEQLKALGLQEAMIEAIAGTDTAQKLAEALALEELAAELDARMEAVFGSDPLGFADSIQAEIDALQTKIDLGPAMGVPQEIIDGWTAEQDALAGQQDQFWADMATAFAQGALDPAVLATLDEAGQRQLEEYLMSMFGQGAYEDFLAQMDAADQTAALEAMLDLPIEDLASGDFIEQQQKKLEELYAKLELAEALGLDPSAILAKIEEEEAILAAAGEALASPIVQEYAAGLEEVEAVSAESLAELARIFEESPDVAVKMIDDLIQAVQDGRLPFSDAMALLANVPDEDLIPALERLEETLTADLAQALLDFGPDSPEVQAILASLGLIDAALGDAADSADAFIGNMGTITLGSPGQMGRLPGPEGADGSPRGNADAVGVYRGDFDQMFPDIWDALQADGSVTVAGWDGFTAAKNQLDATTYIDSDGRRLPRSGYTLYETATGYSVNPFADGGIVTEPTLALLGDNPSGTEGIFPLERAGEFGFGGMDDDQMDALAGKIGAVIAEEMRRAPIQPLLDGRPIARTALQHLSRGAVAGQALQS